MKYFTSLTFVLISLISFAQSDVPAGTLVPVELTQTLNSNVNQSGPGLAFIVSNDVLVHGTKVVSKGAAVHAVITAKKGRDGTLRVDFTDVPGVDGSVIKLQDCWVYTTSEENFKGKGAQFVKGTNKNCYTRK